MGYNQFDSITSLSRNYSDYKDEYKFFIKRGVFLEFEANKS